MTEKFSDLLQFTTQVSRLMVTEIRRRASNKSTGEPSDTWIYHSKDVNTNYHLLVMVVVISHNLCSSCHRDDLFFTCHGCVCALIR